MGSTVSRPRPSQVAPTLIEEEEDQEARHPQPQWTLPALPLTLDQKPLGQKKTALPPLKHATTIPLSESCLAGISSPSTLSNNPSIIHSHPPRKPQALQPLSFQTGHTVTANQIATVRECSDGGVQRFSSISQTGLSGANRLIQGGFLDAQSALSQKSYRHRRAHHRQAREQRRQKTVYTANVGGLNKEGVQRLHIVRRPTEKDIFWDESTGESLDFRHLLQPSPLPPLVQEAKQHKQNNSLLQCQVENPAWSS